MRIVLVKSKPKSSKTQPPQFQKKSDPLRPSAVRLSFHLPLVCLQGLLEQPWCVLNEFPSFIYLCSLQRANVTKLLSFFRLSPISMETSSSSPPHQSHVSDLRICASLAQCSQSSRCVLGLGWHIRWAPYCFSCNLSHI